MLLTALEAEQPLSFFFFKCYICFVKNNSEFRHESVHLFLARALSVKILYYGFLYFLLEFYDFCILCVSPK